MELRKKAAQTRTYDTSDEDDSTPQYGYPHKRLKRRSAGPKKTATNSRARGRLRGLPDLPLDVLLEIFGHLEPLDLLRLARTTKSLRNFLMTESSASVWRQVRLRTGLPEPPKDLSEPAYANLAFSRHCHHCLKPHVMHDIFWEMRTRSCRSCFTQLYVEVSEYNPENKSLLRCVPSSPLGTFPHGRKNGFRYVLKSHYEEVLQGGRSTSTVTSNTSEVEEINAHADLCRKWHEQLIHSRQRDTTIMTLKRTEEIFRRLSDMGWDHADLGNIRMHRLVAQTKPLTERIWNNIEDELVAELEEIRRKRLARESDERFHARVPAIMDLIQKHLDALPFNSVVPPVGDILLRSKYIDALVDDDLTGEDITDEKLADAIASMPSYFQEWRAEKNKLLLEILRRRNPQAQEDALGLATTVFRCRQGCAVGYPRVLIHRHCIYLSSASQEGSPDVGRLDWRYKLRVWKHTDIRLDQRNMSELVSACGWDPDTATTADIDAANPLIKRHSQASSAFGTYNDDMTYVERWTSVREHRSSSHYEALQDHEVRLACKLEQEQLSARQSDICWRKARCRHCGEMRASHGHMREAHGLETVAPAHWTFHIDDPYWGNGVSLLSNKLKPRALDEKTGRPKQMARFSGTRGGKASGATGRSKQTARRGVKAKRLA